MAARFFFGGAQRSTFRAFQRGFGSLAHGGDLGGVALHESGFVLEEAARRLIVAFADNLFLLLGRGFLGNFGFWLGGFAGNFFGFARLALLCFGFFRFG